MPFIHDQIEPMPLITSIHIKDLFGLYSYTLPNDGEFQNAAILYGDNGAGKSTILRLAFHLLSSAGDKGHRNALYKSDFKELSVCLSSGYSVNAIKNTVNSVDILSLSISHNNNNIAEWDFIPSDPRQQLIWNDDSKYLRQYEEYEKKTSKKISVKLKKSTFSLDGELNFLKVLEDIAPSMFILNAERRLDSDSVPDPGDEMELRRLMHYEDARKINDLVTRSREIALSQALATTTQWIKNKAIKGANQGSINVHTVYSEVLKHLVTPMNNKEVQSNDIPDLLDRLTDIEKKTNELAEYEFETPLSTQALKKGLTTRNSQRAMLAAGLLFPYIKSVEGRLEAVTPIFNVVHKFIKIINSLLHDKKISFTLGSGFVIKNRLNAILEPSKLSSGEQQLLLLFCYVLTARDNPSVFMIDEPEISLNVKWQRQLIQSLLDITEKSKIQFIFASHSIELFAQHRRRVVKVIGESHER
ncbi:AAA family ATPase [Aeromonas caviae]|uniref:AAA family ATPase n=1 Tax=Aeromonas caviae TaxID=648 RepID=UPI0030A64EC1